MERQETIELAYSLLKKIDTSGDAILTKFDSTEKQQAFFEFLQDLKQHATADQLQDEDDLLGFSRIIYHFISETSQLKDLKPTKSAYDPQMNVNSKTDEEVYRENEKQKFYNERMPGAITNTVVSITSNYKISAPSSLDPVPSGTVKERLARLLQRLQRFWHKTGN